MLDMSKSPNRINASSALPEVEAGALASARNRIVLAAGGTALLLATFLGGCSDTVDAQLVTTVSASEQTSTTVEQQGVLPTVESLKLPASLMDNPEELIGTFIDRVNAWQMAGDGPDNAKKALLAPMEGRTTEEVTAEIASGYDEAFTQALTIENPAESVALWLSNQITNHDNNLDRTYRTEIVQGVHDPADIEPYQATEVIDSINKIVKNADGSVSVTVTLHLEDNSDKNRVGEDLSGYESVIDKEPVTQTFTFIEVSGSVFLVDVPYSSR
jgi:hypothetical protein